MKRLFRGFVNRILRNPRTTAVALVALVGLIASHFGKSLSTSSQGELIGGIAAVIAVVANLLMRDAPKPDNGNGSVSDAWKPPEGQ